MENNLKEYLDYQEECLEWENNFLRLHKMLSEKEGDRWKSELDYLEKWWERMQLELKKIYGLSEQ